MLLDIEGREEAKVLLHLDKEGRGKRRFFSTH